MINWSNNKDHNSDINKDLVNSINEQKMEQKNLVEIFKTKMNTFATERSIESCLDALNTSIQLSNVRGKLAKSFEYYSKDLESKVIQLNRLVEKYEHD
jgi:hypothetical protein